MDTHCRIGRIKLRSGAEIRVISRDEVRARRAVPECRAFRENAKTIQDHWTDIAGYVMLVWNSEGVWTMGYRNGADSPVRHVDLPRFVADRVRSQGIVNETIEELNWQSGERPPPNPSA